MKLKISIFRFYILKMPVIKFILYNCRKKLKKYKYFLN